MATWLGAFNTIHLFGLGLAMRTDLQLVYLLGYAAEQICRDYTAPSSGLRVARAAVTSHTTAVQSARRYTSRNLYNGVPFVNSMHPIRQLSALYYSNSWVVGPSITATYIHHEVHCCVSFLHTQRRRCRTSRLCHHVRHQIRSRWQGFILRWLKRLLLSFQRGMYNCKLLKQVRR